MIWKQAKKGRYDKMAAPEPQDEAVEILKIVQKYFPKIFEGQDSIRWLHEHTRQGNQREWAAVFFEEYCRPLLTNFLGGWYGVRIVKGSRIDYQRYYNWDLKVHSVKDSRGKRINTVILNDKSAMDRTIELESGIGFIVASVEFKFDADGSLLKWRQKYERAGQPSPKTRTMKKSGKVVDLQAIFIKDAHVLKKGVKDGWISIFKQGRQPDGSARKPKYQIRLDRLPPDVVIELDNVDHP